MTEINHESLTDLEKLDADIEMMRRRQDQAQFRAMEGMTLKFASRGFLPGREATVACRFGDTLQVTAHGPLTASELDYDIRDDANVTYIELVRTNPVGAERRVSLLTPESAIALGERLIEEGQAALEVQEQMVRAEKDE